MLDEIFSDRIFKDESRALSMTAKIDYHVLKGIYFYRINDLPNAYNENKETIMLLEKNPAHIRRDPLFYANAMNNLVAMQRSLAYEEEFLYTLKKLKNLPEQIGNLLTQSSYYHLKYAAYLNELAYR